MVNDGTITGATRVAGKYGGNALRFAGSDYVTILNASSLQATTFTVCFWVKPTNHRGHFVEKAPNPKGWYIRHDSNGKITLEIWNATGTAVQSVSALNLNEYY